MTIPAEIERMLTDFYFYETDRGEKIVRCVIRENRNPQWHHLDDNHGNNDPGNVIPLDPELNESLGGIKSGGRVRDEVCFPHDLRPSVLCKKAVEHAGYWKFGRAIGCLRLAFYVSRPPYLDVDADRRLRIACLPIRLLRHHVNYDILATTLRDVRDTLANMRSARLETIVKLKYNLIALLNERALSHEAAACATDLKGLLTRYRRSIDNWPPDDLGSILRRIAQVGLSYEGCSAQRRQLAELEERASSSRRLRTSLTNTQVLAALAGQDSQTLGRCYEAVSSLCEILEPAIHGTDRPDVGPSDLAEIFLYKALLARIVKPGNYRRTAARSFQISIAQFNVCHAPVTCQYPGFWEDTFQRLLPHDMSRSHPLVRFIGARYRIALPQRIRDHIEEIFQRTDAILVIP